MLPSMTPLPSIRAPHGSPGHLSALPHPNGGPRLSTHTPRSPRAPWITCLTLLLALALVPAGLAQTTAKKPAAKRDTTGATAPAPKPATPPKPPAPRNPDAVALDAIAAMVNDEPVLASDVEEQLFLFLQRAQVQPDSSQVDTLRRQVLDQLIDEKLVLAEAKKQNLTVPAADVQKQVEAAIADAKQRYGGDDGFKEQLARENTTEARLRERYKGDIEKQMLEQQVVKKMFPKRTVTQADAEAYFLAHKDKFPKVPPQLHLQVIQIVPSPDSAALKDGKAKIDAIRKRIVGGEKFAKVAADVSDDPGTAKSGGDLGFFRRGQMEPTIEDAAFGQPNGKLSQPIRTPYGFHLNETMERDTVRGPDGKDSLNADRKPIEEVHARHILVKVTPNDDDVARTQKLAQTVRDQAAKGGDFATLVKKYSTYRGPIGPDGDLGFMSLGPFEPSIRAGLENLKVGDISQVLPSRQGFNIFKVLERKPERDYELGEIKQELPDAVAEAQFRDKYDAWLKTLRSKAQIEYRDL